MCVAINVPHLQHQPHALHVVARVAPVTLGVQVAQVQALLRRKKRVLNAISTPATAQILWFSPKSLRWPHGC